MPNNVHIMVICCKDERKAFQKKQFAALKLPYDVTYAQAFSPASSRAYIADYDTAIPEFDTTLCCMRSHAAVLEWFYYNTSSDYVLVIEDDVAFTKDELAKKIDHIIDLWSKHSSEIDYVNIGYLINGTTGMYPDAANKEDVLYWGKQSYDVWGMQAYLVKRPVVKEMIDVFCQSNTIDLRKKVHELMVSGRDYSHRYPRIQSDSLFPILFRQGFVVPMLAIEMPFHSVIQGQDVGHTRWAKAMETGAIVVSDFYGTD